MYIIMWGKVWQRLRLIHATTAAAGGLPDRRIAQQARDARDSRRQALKGRRLAGAAVTGAACFREAHEWNKIPKQSDIGTETANPSSYKPSKRYGTSWGQAICPCFQDMASGVPVGGKEDYTWSCLYQNLIQIGPIWISLSSDR